jgi:hypothetical protein
VGASWILSEEPIFKENTKWINEFRLRVSYGTVGNQLGIGNFASRELLNATVYNGVGGLLLAQLPYPQLKWETKQMFNTGIDLSVLENRIRGTIEYYNNKTVDLFLDRQLSRTSGFASITANLGKLQNQGVEVSLNAEIIRGRNFNWSVKERIHFTWCVMQVLIRQMVTHCILRKTGLLPIFMTQLML